MYQAAHYIRNAYNFERIGYCLLVRVAVYPDIYIYIYIYIYINIPQEPGASTFSLKLETVESSQILANVYQTTCCYIPQDTIPSHDRREDQKPHTQCFGRQPPKDSCRREKMFRALKIRCSDGVETSNFRKKVIAATVTVQTNPKLKA